ncbi:MAG: type II toxin-antitoxin system VapC family toxin [Candidatus Nanohaloarchaea archaeon]
MTKTVVDTSVLVSLLESKGPNSKARELLGRLRQEGGLFINPVVYGELAASFESKDTLDNFLSETNLKVEAINQRTAYLAGRKYLEYLENRGERTQCPSCGSKNEIQCRNCEETIKKRKNISSDFMIGSHAELQADRLATYDSDFKTEYFSDLNIVPSN